MRVSLPRVMVARRREEGVCAAINLHYINAYFLEIPHATMQRFATPQCQELIGYPRCFHTLLSMYTLG